MQREVLTFVKKKGCHCQLDHQHQRGKTGEETQYQQQGAEDLGKERQDEGPFMSDVERIEEDRLLVAEMHQLGKPMVDADDQPERQTEQ